MIALHLLKGQVTRQIKRSTDYMQIHNIPKAIFKDGGEHPTFNDVPIPQGSWKENYTRKQRRYNMILFSGIASLVLSILYVVTSGEMEMNYSVPDYPYDEEKK